MSHDVEAVYARRFAGEKQCRMQLWAVLIKHFFQHQIAETQSILDLGAGHCEFINQIRAGRKYALDLNPATRLHAGSDVQVISQDVARKWPLESESLDVIFSSNFLEHLPSKDDLQFCLRESHRVLRSGGRLLLLGPNIRFCPDIYWDFFDHYLPLSDRSLSEALELTGFTPTLVIPRFLPFTTKSRIPSHASLVRLYLAVPFAWKLMGKQFFIEAQKG